MSRKFTVVTKLMSPGAARGPERQLPWTQEALSPRSLRISLTEGQLPAQQKERLLLQQMMV